MSGNTPRPRPSGARSTAAKKAFPGRAKRPGSKSKKTRLTPKQQFKRVLRLGMIAGIIGTLMLVSVGYFAYRATTIPDPNTAFQAQTTKVFYADGKGELGSFATQNRESIPLSDIPQVMQDAVVAAEDRTFWTNKGIDPKGILRAAFSNASGGATQGASTITQQYVKILYLSQSRTLSRKIKEAFLSLKIQQQQSKQQILEGYLNTIYFGRGAYGVQAAANAFFGVPASQLNASQSAMLAAVLNSPNYLSPDRSADSRAALLSRYDYVLSGMVAAGTLDSVASSKIEGRLPKLKKQNTSNLYGGQKGFMLDMVKRELLKLGFDDAQIDGGGLRVTTTFTRKAMAAARSAVLQVRPTGLKDLHAAVASVDVKTGAVLGFFAGQDYLKSQLDWSTSADSPGSAFKAFAIAAGIKDGFSLKDTFDGNSPYVFPDGTKAVNEGAGSGTSYGAHVSLTKAAEQSINTAFIDMTQSMNKGPRKMADMAEALGVPTIPEADVNARISLGGTPISPLNMANAYAAIADGGLHHDTFVIAKVTRASDGEVLYTAPMKSDRVLSADIAADTSYALQQVVKTGTGVRAQRIGRPAAGKTGTATDDNGDVITSWFVGYTPQVATAVMYARGNGRKPLNNYLPSFEGSTGYFGAGYPTATWAAAMSGILAGTPVVDFPPPANLDGTAPSSGHAPAPTFQPKPPKPTKTVTTTTPSPTLTPTPTPTPTPTASPSEPVANGVCSNVPGDPDCPQPTSCPVLNPNCTPPPQPRIADRQKFFARQESAA